MLKSMTAFARLDFSTEQGAGTWEVRTVNSRYLESHFKLPESLRELESGLREIQKRYLKRGKVETSLRFQPSAGEEALKVDLALVQAINTAANQINRILDNPAHISALDVMQWPGVLLKNDPDTEALSASLLRTYEEVVHQVVDVREREGEQLRPLFNERLDKIDQIVTDVKQALPAILQKQKEQLRQKLEEVVAELDQQRLEQEMVIAAQKADVAEELERLQAHTLEVRRVLALDEPVGRRLDFLMQELNREANTLSSKSIVTDTTRAAVELKVLIEQMREQVQNIE